jgi:hypothetical protein
MVKYRYYIDKDKEEKWLNQMADNGWALQNFAYTRYTFAPCVPGEYSYQIDMLDNWAGESTDFEAFMAEMDIQLVTRWWRWVYLQKKCADGPFEMYTDVESQIAQYKRIRNFFKIMSLFMIINISVQLLNVSANIHTSLAVPLLCLIAFIGLLSIPMIKMAMVCNNKIYRLSNKEQSSGGALPRRYSVALGLGLLLNAFNLLVKQFWQGTFWTEGYGEILSLVLLIIAITLMVAGIVGLTRNKDTNQ